MSSSGYSSAERGGGAGETGELRAKILNQINSWWLQAHWHDEEKAERIHQKLNEAPERFISPNPRTMGSYREEARRCYNKIKDEFSLRTQGDLKQTKREYADREEAYIREKKRQGETETPAPGEIDKSEPEETAVEESEPVETPEMEPVGLPTDAPEPTPEPVETAEPTEEPPIPDPSDMGLIQLVVWGVWGFLSQVAEERKEELAA